MKSLSIYIHIPFCVQKCVYCDFLSAPATDEIKERYVDALSTEIEKESRKYKDFVVKSVFFGGGTPSILKSTEIARIIHTLKKNFILSDNPEITIEMNPKTASQEKMDMLVNIGFNRLSIGLQSANNDELKMLGRVHSYEDFLNTYEMARNSGFKNINVDLMSAIPGQSLESFMTTLNEVISLKPEHISAYSLIIEEDTYLYDNLSKFPEIPSEEEDREIYQRTKEVLKSAGYERYEISNYSKPGYECKHNLVYWERGNYVGFGIGAASMVENIRWKNTDDINSYLKEILHLNEIDETAEIIQNDTEILDLEAQMEEFMFLGLRKMQGISAKEFEKVFNKKIEDVYGSIISKWVNLGYLVQDGDKIFFSEQGIDISNQILSDFII